jgi:hypothetical protein
VRIKGRGDIMQEEFKRLVELFSLTQEGKSVNLNEVLQESLVFFEKLKETFKEGSEDDKREIMKVMSDMYAKLLEESKNIADRTGMNEDELNRYCENPNNFTPEQWASMQEAKKKMFDSGREISHYLRGKEPPKDAPSLKEKGDKKTVKVKKDKWIPG